MLIADVLSDPFEGIGKPEPLRHVLSGAWSRRIDEKNRLERGIRGGPTSYASICGDEPQVQQVHTGSVS